MATIAVDISVSPASLQKLSAFFDASPKKATRALAAAVNQAASKARTEAKRIIARELGIRGSDLITPHRFGARKGQSTGTALSLVKASGKVDSLGDVKATLAISGKRIPVIYFKAKALPVRPGKPVPVKFDTGWKTVRMRGTGVRWKIGRSPARKIEEAFIATMSSGHTGVFARAGGGGTTKSGNARLVEFHGPSVPHAAERSSRLKAALNVDVTESFNRSVQHEIKRIMEEA